ncbi:hypothetical protein P9989_03990 [Halobacillus naozhouensis]|uniref:Uncharacterized protein n=1 Tax=Halobacillus naozhouensis TaxID=554880 RepID=A0ABY8J7N6_9BACI|nr:hypothetical protein [Halobacillus naozhouensis]WFT76881.1 hypothetical protein P9989_03990 [Halobacillus naozhouensis]
MFLYFKTESLGEIKNIKLEGMWMYGSLNPNESMQKYKGFLEALVNEENDFQEDKYCEDLLEDKNWFIVDKQQNKRGIYLPAVYEDGEINWRWR